MPNVAMLDAVTLRDHMITLLLVAEYFVELSKKSSVDTMSTCNKCVKSETSVCILLHAINTFWHTDIYFKYFFCLENLKNFISSRWIMQINRINMDWNYSKPPFQIPSFMKLKQFRSTLRMVWETSRGPSCQNRILHFVPVSSPQPFLWPPRQGLRQGLPPHLHHV